MRRIEPETLELDAEGVPCTYCWWPSEVTDAGAVPRARLLTLGADEIDEAAANESAC